MNRAGAETAVLGCALVDPQAFWRVADRLTADDFTNDEHRALWDEIASLLRAGKPADAVTIGESKPPLWSAASACTNASFSTANVSAYADWVIAESTQRKVAQAGQRIAKLAGADCLAEAQRILGACMPRAVSAARSMREILKDTVNTLHQRYEATEVLTGLETSLTDLDEMTAGWQRGDLIIVAARPSVGKTAFALQVALHAAKLGSPVFFASLEQSSAQLSERSLSNYARVPLQSIRRPKTILEEEWPRITNATKTLSEFPIQIDETGALTIDAIGARARQVNATRRLGLIVIDYLTQIQPPKAEKTTDAIQTITRAAKALAKELAVPVMLLSQLNRDGEDRPTLRSLRDSGAIEQDADVVIFLHRPDAEKRELVQLIVGKQRNGPIGDIWLHADMEHMRFIPTDDRPAAKQTRGFGRNVA